MMQGPSANCCLLLDATCDLPQAFIAHPAVRMLPIRVKLGDMHLLDTRNVATLPVFYSDYLRAYRAVDASTQPLSVEEVQEHIATQLLPTVDNVLGVFVTATRSHIFSLVKTAMNRMVASAIAQRAIDGRITPLSLECLDSQSAFAGYAVQAVELLEQFDRGKTIAQLAEHQRFIQPYTTVYAVSGDAYYLLKRAGKVGEKSMGPLGFLLARHGNVSPLIKGNLGKSEVVKRTLGQGKAINLLLDAALRLLARQMLLAPHICFSYSGELARITENPRYQKLCSAAKTAGVHVHMTPMGMTNTIMIGPNSLTMGVLAQRHSFAELVG